MPTADVAAEIREALACTDGYLRDAAATFLSWQVSPEQVRCPTWLWCGDQDANASVRNRRWLAVHIPRATLVVRTETTHLATQLEHWQGILTTCVTRGSSARAGVGHRTRSMKPSISRKRPATSETRANTVGPASTSRSFNAVRCACASPGRRA